ncbi:MAG TPA: DUF488 domain-containing protein [Planctomycetota bacterium]
MAGVPTRLSTIGYEGRTPEEFLDVLRKAGVTLVCDVRRNPISRKRGFSKGSLGRALGEAGLRYEHLPELGIAAARRKNLTPAAKKALFDEYERVDLPKLAQPLARIAAWAKEGEKVALLCFERDPADCHRSRVAAALGAKTEPL